MPGTAHARGAAFGLTAWLGGATVSLTAWLGFAAVAMVPMAATAQVRPLETPAAPGSGMISLAASPTGEVFLTWIEPAGRPRRGQASTPRGNDGGAPGHALRVSRFDGERWTAPATVATGRDWFVNWADHPGLAAVDARTLVAHWLVKSGEAAGVYGYGIRLARSTDAGATWEHVGDIGMGASDDYSGFVTWMVERDRLRLAYLAPRAATTPATGTAATASAGSGAASAHEAHGEDAAKTLVIATITPQGIARDTTLTLDDDTCQCCTTSSAMTSNGAVIVYRDHLPGEIRDIAIIRETQPGDPPLRGSADPEIRSPQKPQLLEPEHQRPAEESASNGEARRGWTRPAPVARDGWVMPGCPTNGPVVAARDARVAVAWFTAAHDTPRVKVAFSDDAGATFEAPIAVGADAPHGWPAIVMLDDGSAVVSWMEGTGADGDVRVRRVWRDGRMTAPQVVATVRAGRSAGIPQMVRLGDALIVAWRTDRVESALVPVPAR